MGAVTYKAKDILTPALSTEMGRAHLAFFMAKAVRKVRFFKSYYEMAKAEIGMYRLIGHLRTGERVVFVYGGQMVRPAQAGQVLVRPYGETYDG